MPTTPRKQDSTHHGWQRCPHAARWFAQIKAVLERRPWEAETGVAVPVVAAGPLAKTVVKPKAATEE